MPPLKIIKDPTALKKEMSAAFWEARKGRLDAKVLNALSVAANVLLGIMEAEHRHQGEREVSPLMAFVVELAKVRRSAGVEDEEVGGLSPEVEKRLVNQADQAPTPLESVKEEPEQEQPRSGPRPLPRRIHRALAVE